MIGTHGLATLGAGIVLRCCLLVAIAQFGSVLLHLLAALCTSLGTINADFRAELEEAVIDAYHVQLVAAEHDAQSSEDAVVI